MSPVVHVNGDREKKKVILDDGRVMSYTWLHRHLRKTRKPCCFACGSRKHLDWALRREKPHYSLDVRDFLSLCRRHHMAYDAGRELTTWLGCSHAEGIVANDTSARERTTSHGGIET